MPANLLNHQQCPECLSEGRDNGRDNLGVYSDGHHYCFSCGYYRPGNKIANFSQRHRQVDELPQQNNYNLCLPSDSNVRIPNQALQWLTKYGLDKNALTKYNIMWSESRQFLLFPYFIEGQLVAWQGRYFGNDPKIGKWHTKGKVEQIHYTLGLPSTSIVLVEDIISAIKVSRVCLSSPLFGSVISNHKFTLLKKYYDTIYIWLDPDKTKQAINFGYKGGLFGLDCRVIVSGKDPKEYSTEEIEKYIHDKTGSSPS